MATEETQVEQTQVTAAPGVKTTVRKVVKDAQIKTEHPQVVYETKKSIFRTYQVVWYILGVIEVLLAFRVLLRVIAANPSSGFASFIYVVSAPFAGPFAGVLGVSVEPSIGSVMEWSTLLAMAVYWIVAYGIVQLFQFVKPVTPDEVEETVDSQ